MGKRLEIKFAFNFEGEALALLARKMNFDGIKPVL